MAVFIHQGRAGEVYSPEVLLKHWVAIRPYTPLDELLAGIEDKAPLVVSIIGSEFDTQLSDLYLSVLRHADPDLGRAISDWSVRGTRAQDAATWKAEIERPAGLLALARYLAEQGYQIYLSDAFRSALLSFAAEVAAGSHPPTGEPEDWAAYFSLLDPDGRMMWRDELYELAKQRSGEIAPTFFSIFGEELAGSESACSDQAFVSHLVVPLLTKRHLAGLIWWRQFMRVHPGWAGSLRDRYRGVLRAALFEQENSDDAAAEQIRGAIRDLDFRRPRPKKQ